MKVIEKAEFIITPTGDILFVSEKKSENTNLGLCLNFKNQLIFGEFTNGFLQS